VHFRRLAFVEYNSPAYRRSRFKGVSVRQHPFRPFRASIEVHGKQQHLGYFELDIEAAKAYDAAALQHFGRFAHVNFPQATAA
jgi:hypothetical protein